MVRNFDPYAVSGRLGSQFDPAPVFRILDCVVDQVQKSAADPQLVSFDGSRGSPQLDGDLPFLRNRLHLLHKVMEQRIEVQRLLGHDLCARFRFRKREQVVHNTP